MCVELWAMKVCARAWGRVGDPEGCRRSRRETVLEKGKQGGRKKTESVANELREGRVGVVDTHTHTTASRCILSAVIARCVLSLYILGVTM